MGNNQADISNYNEDFFANIKNSFVINGAQNFGVVLLIVMEIPLKIEQQKFLGGTSESNEDFFENSENSFKNNGEKIEVIFLGIVEFFFKSMEDLSEINGELKRNEKNEVFFENNGDFFKYIENFFVNNWAEKI